MIHLMIIMACGVAAMLVSVIGMAFGFIPLWFAFINIGAVSLAGLGVFLVTGYVPDESVYPDRDKHK